MRPMTWVLLAVAATAAACGSATPTSLPPPPTISAAAPVVPGLTTGDRAALRARLLAFPAKTQALLVPGTVDGGLDLAAYVSYRFGTQTTTQQADERAALTADGFQFAVERHWTGPGKQVTSLEMVEFADASGADKLVQAQDSAYAGNPAYTFVGTSSALGGETFVSTARESSGYYETLATGEVDNIYLFVQQFSDPAASETSIQEIIAQQARSAIVTPTPSGSPSATPTTSASR